MIRDSPKRAAAARAEENFKAMAADPLAGALDDDDAAQDAADERKPPGSARKALPFDDGRRVRRPSAKAAAADDDDADFNSDGAANSDDDFEKPPRRARASAGKQPAAKRVPKRAKPTTTETAEQKAERAEAQREAKERARSVDPKERNAHCVSGGGRRYTDEEVAALPVLTSPHDMFADVSRRLPALGDVAKASAGWARPLRVATMCSGTESPLLALEMLSEACRAQHGQPLNWEHVFSCEIEPFKQAYIERNFSPPLLFRDIRELCDPQATTAYGALVKVPGLVDVLVAGTSCVDYSCVATLAAPSATARARRRALRAPPPPAQAHSPSRAFGVGAANACARTAAAAGRACTPARARGLSGGRARPRGVCSEWHAARETPP
jgi:hypothetical protein